MRLNFRLPSRGACIVADCVQTCFGFVAENPDGTPKYADFDNPETICFICGHPWITHVVQASSLTEQNQMFARGGTSDGRCAAFFSTSTTWTMHLACICGLKWSAHAQLTQSSSLPSTTSNTSAPAPVPSGLVSTSVSAGASSSIGVPHRPVTAFTGLARPSTASVQQARQASIQRNLHGSAAGSSSLATSSSPTSPKKKRKSGPPRSFTETSASIPALNDFAAVTAPTSAIVWCGILPKVLDTSDFNDTLDLSPRFFWKSAEEIENVQTTLKTAGLVFTVDVSTTGPIFEAIELAFRDHCATNNIDYVAPALTATIPSAGWRIKCLITHDYSEAYPTVDAAGNDDFGPDVVIDFRSCFKTFSITNNARLRHLLISENAEAGKDTTFGRLFHAQLLASQNAYTSSRRLNGEAPSPVRPLPQRSRTPHYRLRSDELSSVLQVEDEVDDNMEVVVEHSEAGDSVPELDFDNWPEEAMGEDLTVTLNPEVEASIHHFMTAPGLDFLENALSSSPSYPLAPISTNPSPAEGAHIHDTTSHHSPTVHSPRARYPISRSTSFASSSLGFPLTTGSPIALDFPSTRRESDSDLNQLFPPVNPNPVLAVAPPSRAGNGSLAALRERERLRRTPAPPIPPAVSPSPLATEPQVPVYLGLPSENPAQCSFLELVSNLPSAPSLRDLIRAICDGSGTAAEMLNSICHQLDRTEFCIACSQRLIEVQDPTFSMLQNTYSEKGSLRSHLDSSVTVIAPRAAHTPNSHEIFRIRGIAEATSFFVLYVFPRYHTTPTPSSSSATPVPLENSRPASRSTSRTPMPQPPLIVQRCLANLALVSAALDQHFLPEAYQLSTLLEDDGSHPKFGTAYTQIRQILIVEDVIARARGSGIPTSDDYKITDTVPLWAALKLSTYGNNKTFTRDARATLMYLQDRHNSSTTPASTVDELKENALRRFLEVCFAPALATSHIAQSLDRAGGSGIAITIRAKVKAVKAKLSLYKSLSYSLRDGPLTVVVPVP
ncbi:hypothetical protein R3P38DRAFT_3360643 [Favolaschia claudopus]|uniref:Uncharacterized protein n=1 Tax=Favolaschia claudopus TaxID=2862362 RepID=A0AAW0AWM5_9AGAR